MVARGWLLLILAAMAVMAGVLAALTVRVGDQPAPPSGESGIQVSELFVGAPIGQNVHTKSPRGQLNGKGNYHTGFSRFVW